jgi:sugar/nucleoside kinase (ribokinase family)
MREMIRALVIGAMSRDLDTTRPDEGVRPGGAVYYAGAALARLGAQVRSVTRVRPDDAAFLLAPLHAEGIESLALPSRLTTTYRNDYSGDVDVHELCATSDRIAAEDVPEAWRSADVIQLGPLHPNDLDPGLPGVLRGRIGIDVQGLVRQQGATRALAPYPQLARLLENVDVVQGSEAELAPLLAGDSLEHFRRRYAVGEVLVTRGARGATLLVGDRRLEVPALRVEGRHPVGAGDVFLAAYLLGRAEGLAPADAASGAAEVCAAKIERGEVPKGRRSRRA